MDGSSLFFVQTVNHHQPLTTEAVPVLTLNVYSEAVSGVAKLDSSIQFVCDPRDIGCTLNVELTRNGVYVTSHVVQFDGSLTYIEDGFLVSTDHLTWVDKPDLGINIYQVTALIVQDDSKRRPKTPSVFAGTRSLNATVFP